MSPSKLECVRKVGMPRVPNYLADKARNGVIKRCGARRDRVMVCGK